VSYEVINASAVVVGQAHELNADSIRVAEANHAVNLEHAPRRDF
jgi:hypothetical protein